MPYITLIPGILCIFVLLRSGTRSAFLNVFLPVLLLFPTNFFLQITHLPNLTFVDVTLLALGAGLVVLDLPRWRFTRMDLYVLLFIFSCGYSEWIHFRFWRAGALALMEGLVPYMAAKLLLSEPQMQVKTARRWMILAAAGSVVSMYEFVFKRNPYSYFWSHFYPGQWGGASTQLRWGFGRVAGPYTQSELAGMILMASLLLALWLLRWQSARFGPGAGAEPPLKYARIATLIIAGTLYTTQARGPWIGTLVALPVASIGLARRPGRRGALVLVLALVVGIPAYQFAKDYSSGPRTDYGSEKETAQYRAELIDNYIPLAESGGAWGMGRMLPIVRGQSSIDNEFLFVWLVQGFVGLATFILIVVETGAALVRVGIRTQSRRDRHLFFTLFGILVGILFTLSTVWLGAQSFELLFLLAGWAQTAQPRAMDEVEESVALREPEAMKVYT